MVNWICPKLLTVSSWTDVLLHPGGLPLRRLQLLRQQPRPLWLAQHQPQEGVPQGDDHEDDYGDDHDDDVSNSVMMVMVENIICAAKQVAKNGFTYSKM